jgi:HEAT repeat protein
MRNPLRISPVVALCVVVVIVHLSGLAAEPRPPGRSPRSQAMPTASRRATAQSEYERIKESFPDTADGQWRLAEWCRQHNLAAAREVHLKRVLDLDPDHPAARRALGYQKREGRWVTQEQVMTERGYVRYRGRWRLPQEVKQLEAKRKQTAAENQWQANLKRWRAWLNDERAAEATARIRAINDPTAIKALTTQLPDEPSQNVRLLYVDALARIGTPEAVMALVDVSLLDPLEEVRLTAIDHLAEKKLPEVVAMYIKALRSKDNNVVNRAAVGLAHMENVAAIPPLIDALITTHEYAIVQGSPGISTSFGSVSGPGGTAPVSGLSVGQSTTYVAEQVRNAAVRDALIKLTGMNYDFDVATWKAWLASRRKAQSLDARRG